MSGRLRCWIAAAATAVALAGCGSTSLNGYLQDNYRQVTSEDGGRSRVFASTAAAAVTADRIADRFRPLDRVSRPQGQFLRYDDVIVGVTPSGGGSRIYLDPSDRGYRRWAVFVGTRWRPPVGRGEGFRGGGPGGGK
jgi:Domain of unknown function (DUF4247)